MTGTLRATLAALDALVRRHQGPCGGQGQSDGL
jgi:hypothetical protein